MYKGGALMYFVQFLVLFAVVSRVNLPAQRRKHNYHAEVLVPLQFVVEQQHRHQNREEFPRRRDHAQSQGS